MKVPEEQIISPEEFDALFGEGRPKVEISEGELERIRDRWAKAYANAAIVLSSILKREVHIHRPTIEVVEEPPTDAVHIKMQIKGEKNVETHIAFPFSLSAAVADIMMGGDGKTEIDKLNELYLGALGEAWNQVAAALAKSLSTSLQTSFDASCSTPTLFEAGSIPEGVWIKMDYRMEIEDVGEDNFSQIFSPEVAKIFAKEAKVSKKSEPAQPSVKVHPVQFAPLRAQEKTPAPSNIDFLIDVPMQVTVELGRTQMLLKDILEISVGSIIQLDKLAGEPVDLLVNGKLIAKGGVVVIDENFGIRITEIVSPTERLSKLR